MSATHSIDTAPLKKALAALKKCHADITDGNSTVERLKKELDHAMETTNPSNDSAINSIATLKIRLDLLPGFIRKVMLTRPDLSRTLRAEIDPLWEQLFVLLARDQEIFRDQYEKVLLPIFGKNSRAVLNQSPNLPSGNWLEADRNALQGVHENMNKSADPAENYPREAVYDHKVIAAAERLLEIIAAYTPYQPKKAA